MKDDPKIIWIAGTGRSGTTLLAKLIDSTPEVLYRHEPDYSNVNTEIPFLLERESMEIYTKKARTYIKALTRQRDPKTSGTRPKFRKSFRTPVGETAHRVSAFTAKAAAKIGLKLNIPDYISNTNTPVYLIKSVNSLCRSALFCRAYDKLRLVHIVRHPAGVIASQLRGQASGLMNSNLYIDALFDSRLATGYPFARNEVLKMSREEKAAFQWMVMNDTVYTSLRGSDQYLPVSYEQICKDARFQIGEILSFAGLQYHEQTSQFISSLSQDPNVNGGYFSVIKNLSSSTESWKIDLSRDSIERINSIASNSIVYKSLGIDA